MTSAVTDRLNALAARPKTHRVIVTRADGTERHFDAHCLAAAQNYAEGERRSLGKERAWRKADLTWGKPSAVTSIEVRAL